MFKNLIPLFTFSNQKPLFISTVYVAFAILESTAVLPSVERNSCDLQNMLQCDQKCAQLNIKKIIF